MDAKVTMYAFVSILLFNFHFPLLSVPTVVISESVSKWMVKSINLTCQGTKSGCHVTKVNWSGPDGINVNTAFERTLNDRLTSTLVVNGSSFGKQYTCTINYTGGSATGVYMYTYTGWSRNVVQKSIVTAVDQFNNDYCYLYNWYGNSSSMGNIRNSCC